MKENEENLSNLRKLTLEDWAKVYLFAVFLSCTSVCLFLVANLFLNPGESITVSEPSRIVSGIEVVLLTAALLMAGNWLYGFVVRAGANNISKGAK